MLKKVYLFLLVTSIIFSSFAVFSVNTAYATDDLKIGAWVGTQPTDAKIKEFNSLQNRKLDIVHMFINWSTNFDWVRTYADPVYANGSVLMITWEPWEYDTVKIKNGNADSYIRKMASDIKAYGKEIWLRPLHEANGNWYPWGIGDSKVNTNDTYIAAFRHIVDVFRSQGATNVKWVFNLNCNNVGANATFTGFYPGDQYVDYTSIDGYNWGTTQSWGSTWQSFDQIFLSAYNALKPYNKPILIGEFASTEVGGDKARWITESFNTIRSSYDKVFAAIWFSENKETDWRINSSESSLSAYKKAVAVGTEQTPPPSSPVVKYGDVNGDNDVNAGDYTLIRRYILGNITEFTSPLGKTAADVNGDGQINAGDYTLVRRYILDLIDIFPVE